MPDKSEVSGLEKTLDVSAIQDQSPINHDDSYPDDPCLPHGALQSAFFPDLQIGYSIRILFNQFCPKPYSLVYHVRGFVDNMVILRCWSKRRQGWVYSVEPEYWYELNKNRMEIKKQKIK